jgi:hypothetical protein
MTRAIRNASFVVFVAALAHGTKLPVTASDACEEVLNACQFSNGPGGATLFDCTTAVECADVRACVVQECGDDEFMSCWETSSSHGGPGGSFFC